MLSFSGLRMLTVEHKIFCKIFYKIVDCDFNRATLLPLCVNKSTDSFVPELVLVIISTLVLF